MLTCYQIQKLCWHRETHRSAVDLDEHGSLLVYHVFAVYGAVDDIKCIQNFVCILYQLRVSGLELVDRFSGVVDVCTFLGPDLVIFPDGGDPVLPVSGNCVDYVFVSEDAFLKQHFRNDCPEVIDLSHDIGDVLLYLLQGGAEPYPCGSCAAGGFDNHILMAEFLHKVIDLLHGMDHTPSDSPHTMLNERAVHDVLLRVLVYV